MLTLHWQVIDGQPEAVGLDLASSLDPESIEQRFKDEKFAAMSESGIPVKTAVLRSLNLAEVIAEERVRTAGAIRRLWPDPGHELAERRPSPQVEMRDATRRRLEQAAEVYRRAWREGERPSRAVAQHFGVSDSAAGKLVYRARSAGLLPATTKGVARAPVGGGDVSVGVEYWPS